MKHRCDMRTLTLATLLRIGFDQFKVSLALLCTQHTDKSSDGQYQAEATSQLKPEHISISYPAPDPCSDEAGVAVARRFCTRDMRTRRLSCI